MNGATATDDARYGNGHVNQIQCVIFFIYLVCIYEYHSNVLYLYAERTGVDVRIRFRKASAKIFFLDYWDKQTRWSDTAKC